MDMITDASHVARLHAERAEHAKREAQAASGRPTTLTTATLAASGEYLTFSLGQEEYGIDILRVQEIRSYEPPTRIAHAPAFLRGVINLRGVIVPIVDLRLKLGCDSAELNPFTVVIVLNLRGRVVGAVVDSVSDVVALTTGDIRPAPQLCASSDGACIIGIGSLAERLLILIDIDALMNSPETGLSDAPLR